MPIRSRPAIDATITNVSSHQRPAIFAWPRFPIPRSTRIRPSQDSPSQQFWLVPPSRTDPIPAQGWFNLLRPGINAAAQAADIL